MYFIVFHVHVTFPQTHTPATGNVLHKTSHKNIRNQGFRACSVYGLDQDKIEI